MLTVAVALAVLSWSYPIGTTMRMGAGYWPRLLVGVSALLGVLLMLGSLTGPMVRVTLPHGRPILFVCLAVFLFAATVDRLGLVIGAALLIAVGAIASGESRWREVALLALGLIAFSVILFCELLGLAIRPLPEGWHW